MHGSMAKPLIAILLILGVGNIASAKTYYETLKEEYSKATSPIAEADIDQAGYPFARTCIEVDPNLPMTEVFVMINRYTRISEGSGPLLPQVTITKVIYRSYNSEVFTENIFDMVTTEFSPKEIKTWHSSTPDIKIWHVTIKKKEDSLIFKREAFVGDNKARTFYGYCFHRDGDKSVKL
ncbi:MAG: hypothetical protein AABY64_12075 [Bdellovibrionota bacterium]